MKPSEINLPHGITIVEPNLSDLKLLKQNEISQLLNTNEIIEFVTSRNVLCIINDAHRATPSTKILRELVEIANNKINAVAIATGTHVAPTQEEIKVLIGNIDTTDLKIIIHDSLSSDNIKVGITSRGTEIWLNPVVLEYEHILCINSVEPHYFAGFTGGIKSVIPGLAARSTVEKNHSWALHPRSEPLNILDNPLSLDLWEARNLINAKIYGIQMVSVGPDIYGVHTGELRYAFESAVLQASKVFSVKVASKFDIILSVVYPPLDRSLYQAQKGIENTRQALKAGGELILLAECKEGIGNTAFYDTIRKYETPEEVTTALTQENYRFGDHKAYKFATMAIDANVKIVSTLTEKECKSLFAEYLDITQLEGYLREQKNEGKTILVVVDSGTLVVTS